jgi:flagellar motor switch protein FliN
MFNNPKYAQQFIDLVSNAFARVDPKAAKPEFHWVDSSAPEGYSWQCVNFERTSEFRVFSCLSAPITEEDAVTAKEQVTQHLNTAFAHFSKIAGVAMNGSLGRVMVSDEAPLSTVALLQMSGVPGLEGMMLGLDMSAVNWFETNVHTTDPSKTKRSSLMNALMDVELPVSILLASRQALFSDVLKWEPGAIVEFDASLGDPVDVIVNNQVVARGSIVLVDGNYGVKVTDVVANDAVLA